MIPFWPCFAPVKKRPIFCLLFVAVWTFFSLFPLISYVWYVMLSYVLPFLSCCLSLWHVTWFGCFSTLFFSLELDESIRSDEKRMVGWWMDGCWTVDGDGWMADVWTDFTETMMTLIAPVHYSLLPYLTLPTYLLLPCHVSDFCSLYYLSYSSLFLLRWPFSSRRVPYSICLSICWNVFGASAKLQSWKAVVLQAVKCLPLWNH